MRCYNMDKRENDEKKERERLALHSNNRQE